MLLKVLIIITMVAVFGFGCYVLFNPEYNDGTKLDKIMFIISCIVVPFYIILIIVFSILLIRN